MLIWIIYVCFSIALYFILEDDVKIYLIFYTNAGCLLLLKMFLD